MTPAGTDEKYVGARLADQSCGAIDCVNQCDGDFTHETCPYAIKARGGRLAGQDIDWQARALRAEARIIQLEAARPPGLWIGICGHMWDRAEEDTAKCPRCALRSKFTKLVEGLERWQTARKVALTLTDKWSSEDFKRAWHELGEAEWDLIALAEVSGGEK